MEVIKLKSYKKKKSVALFLRLGLPSTIIRHENETLRKKTFQTERKLKTPALHLVLRKTFEKQMTSRAVISFPVVSSTTNPK